MSSVEGVSSPKKNVVDSAPTTAGPETHDVARIRRPSIEERLASKMIAYSRAIICLFVAVTLTFGFAAIHSAPPRISKPPSARPFFNQNSVILDFYKGHLDAMVKRASDADLSFVMYYAPWDAESQTVRHEFENVAQYYYSRVFFAAINCWHPGSECRAQYSKIQSYPVLILYPSRDTPIEYRGINTAAYMMRFLDGFLRPINRITSREQYSQLLAESDAVVTGFIEFKGLSVSPGYKEFYRLVTRFLERDPNRDVTFAVVTDPVTAANEFGIFSFPSATLSMWNETLIYPPEKSWTSYNLMNWIGASTHKVALWLQPPGVKSLTLAPYMRDGPVLFLFTPRNPLHRVNYNYNLMKKVALQYYSCGEVLLTGNLVERLRENIRQSAVKHLERSKRCAKILNENYSKSNVPAVSVSVQQWINDSCCAKVVLNKCLMSKKHRDSGRNAEAEICSVSQDNLQEICKGSDVFRSTEDPDDYEKHHFCSDDERSWREHFNHKKPTDSVSKKYESSMLTGENDPRSAKSVRNILVKEQCTKLLAGNKYHYPIFPAESQTSKKVEVSVSACNANKTLAFIAIDSLQYFHFAEALGIDLLKTKDKTAVIILDSDQESQYLMKGDLSRDSLVQFVNEYTDGLLQRTLRSDSSKRFARDFKTSKGCESVDETEICVRELTTETFSTVVMDPTMDVVVMYHSPYCAFCSAVAYAYLTVAKYLSNMDYLTFVRIDGDNNDLPWEYSMDRYPSILFFPAKRKEDSTVFPFSLPVTIPNLLNFVLANLADDSHVEALVNICSLGSGEPPRDCVARIRRLCLDIIEKLLKKYRKFGRNRDSVPKIRASNVKREILLRLGHIRDVHLILGSVDDLRNDRDKLQQIRQRFKTYYKNLVALVRRNFVNRGKSAITRNIANQTSDKKNEKIPKDEL